MLRRDHLTVNEMATMMGVSRNAIILPLRQLEAEGLVEAIENVRGKIGKPAVVYHAVAGFEDNESNAYPAFTELLLDALSEDQSTKEIERTMVNIGRKMALQLNVDEDAGFSTRLATARQFVDGLGANTAAERKEGTTIVRCFNCPLARAVRREACVCKAVSSFFAHATNMEVIESCIRDDKLVCQFKFIETQPQTVS